METPASNDSLKASLSPPVGGRLRSFRRDWQTNKCSNIMLDILTIHHQSKLSQSSPDCLRTQGLSKIQLWPLIQSLLSKNAIERVENVKSLWFYNRLFLIPKPHLGWRPMTDMSRLPPFLFVERFKWKLQSPSGPL